MEEIIIYKADDGKEFDDENECRDYENNLKAEQYKDIIKIWNNYGERIDLKDALSNSEIIYAIQIDTDDELVWENCKKFIEIELFDYGDLLYKLDSRYNNDKWIYNDIYRYDETFQEWLNISVLYESCSYWINKLK